MDLIVLKLLEIMKKTLLAITTFFVVAALILGAFLLINSPGSTSLSKTAGANGIAEVRDVMINGVQQRLLVRGDDRSNPVMLHLHGGPGGPDQAMIQSYGKTLEDMFTVVYWDQRGSGASYDSSMEAQVLSLDQLVEDAATISEMLLEEFDKETLYLLGHSWGTLLGANLVSQEPGLFKAFFAIGLFSNAKRAEKLSWEYALSKAQEAGDTDSVKRLQRMGSPPYVTDQEWIKNVFEHREILRPYENPNAEPLFDMLEVYTSFALYKGYTLSEKLGSLNGSKYTMKHLWPTVIATDLTTSHTQFEVPVFVFQGKYDQHTVTEVAKDYFDKIRAPEKKYYLFESSAHWPHIKEYGLYRKYISRHLKELEGQTAD